MYDVLLMLVINLNTICNMEYFIIHVNLYYYAHISKEISSPEVSLYTPAKTLSLK